MPYGLYISAEGAAAQSQRMEVLSHNLANVDTVGFKKELAVLQARHSEAIAGGDDYAGSRSINDVGGGVKIRETMTQFGVGPLKSTGIQTDMAIEGEGFFVVNNDGQQMLTRAGNFQFTPDGCLITQQGHSVLAVDGSQIVIQPDLPWELGRDGVISQQGNIFPLGLVKPAALGDLARAGENLFKPLADTIPLLPEERHVRHKYLELSGVKPTTAMMEMIEASRAFESNIRMIQSQDRMIGTLVNRVLRQT